jgi:hypothetical protein
LAGRNPAARSVLCLLVCALLLQTLWPRAGAAVEEYGRIATRLVKIIAFDDRGMALGYPSRVIFDHRYQETYVLSSTGRITIYDKNYFPLGSIGPGRGVEHVIGMAIGPAGGLHLARHVYDEVGKGRQAIITIYNNALLVEREIILREIPELADLMVNDLAVAGDGTIYLVGARVNPSLRAPGAAVLDRLGNFQGWLAPRGRVAQPAAAETAPAAPATASVAVGAADPGFSDNLPPGLKPAPARDRRAAAGGEGDSAMVEVPTVLESVYVDVTGRIYLLSAELSEIYAYDQDQRYRLTLGLKGGAKGKLSTPKALAVDYPRRLVYVADYMRHTIVVYDYDSGKFVYEFGGKGVAPLWYQHPNYLAVDGEGLVAVADLFNRRIQVVDPASPERPVLIPRIPDAAVPEPPAAEVLPPAAEVLPPAALLALDPAGMLLPRPQPPVVPPRAITPDRLKKKITSRPLPNGSGAAAIAPMRLPAPPLVPPVLAGDGLPAAPANAGGPAQPTASLSTIVGVYGPVAVLVGFTIRLLKR